jgi:hypothetical protein
MKNTYILTIDYDQEKAKSSTELTNVLNISEERFRSLMAAAIFDRSRSLENGENDFDGFASFMRILEEDKLTGNELILYAVTGYLSALRLMPSFSNAAEALGEAGVEDITV